MRSVLEIGDELYGLAPAEFIAARDAEVGQARQRGDKASAAALAAFKRPTQGAHLVNLLALRRPESVHDLLELGARLREAQSQGDAAALRDLSTQRRRRLDEAVALSSSLAEQAGSGPATQAQLGEVRSTLEAAMADDDAAELVRTARVTKALVYAGFGVPGGEMSILRNQQRIPGKVKETAKGVAPTVRPDKTDADAQREAAQARAERERERAAAQHEVAQAEAALKDARTAEREADERVATLTAELTALRDELDAAQARVRAARTARLGAERAHAMARRIADRLQP